MLYQHLFLGVLREPKHAVVVFHGRLRRGLRSRCHLVGGISFLTYYDRAERLCENNVNVDKEE